MAHVVGIVRLEDTTILCRSRKAAEQARRRCPATGGISLAITARTQPIKSNCPFPHKMLELNTTDSCIFLSTNQTTGGAAWQGQSASDIRISRS